MPHKWSTHYHRRCCAFSTSMAWVATKYRNINAPHNCPARCVWNEMILTWVAKRSNRSEDRRRETRHLDWNQDDTRQEWGRIRWEAAQGCVRRDPAYPSPVGLKAIGKTSELMVEKKRMHKVSTEKGNRMSTKTTWKKPCETGTVISPPIRMP
jgi:hypothetical protein